MSEIILDKVSDDAQGSEPESSGVLSTKESGSDPALTAQTWNKVIRGIIYALTFLLPVLFTPWTFEPLEFSKQMLLFVMTSAALVAWLLRILVLRQVKLVKTPLDVPIGIFLLIYLLASIFSVDRVASFLGFYGSFYGNFFQVLFLVLFYYLIVNNFNSIAEIKKLLGIFFFSMFCSLAYIVLQFFGAYVFRFSFAKINSFNTVGGLLMITLFSALAVVLSLGYRAKSWFNIFSGKVWRTATLVAAFIILLTVNFLYAWAGLLIGLLVYMIFQFGFSKTAATKDMILPFVLLILVISFVVIQLVFPSVSVRNIFSFNLPSEVRLDYKTSQPVITGIVTTRPILGTGPNTFQYAFSKHRDENFNLTPFWNVRFDKAPSEAAESLIGTGILGFLAFEVLNLIFIIYALFFLFRKKDEESWNTALTLFTGFAVLWFAHWFFFFNTIVFFAFWLLMGSFVAVTRIVGGERVKALNFSLTSTPRQTIGILSTVVLGLVVVVVFMFFVSAVYASDIFYRKGLVASQDPKNFDEAQASLERAVRLNRFRPDYYLTYGEFLFLRINQELSKSRPNLGQIQSWLASSINTSRLAVNLSPSNWTAWERLANLYTFARPLVAGVDKFIIESLTRAIENDDKNPILFAELGQVYRLAARRLDPSILGTGIDSDSDGLSDAQEQALKSDPEDPDTNGNGVLDGNEVLAGLNPASSGNLPDDFLGRYIKTDPQSLLKAEESFRKAIALKDDYAAAYYNLALTLEQANKLDKAIEELEKALQRFPTNVTIKFDLGRLYFNTGKVDEAAKQFQEIAILVPNNSNALFSLAVSYERLGRTRRALDNYRKVLDLNPDNQSIKTKIAELEQILAQQQPQ